MAWSEEQLAAIETYDKDILVAAAAGSGKTSVLVERIIGRVLDDAQSFDIDRVLVVTFTKAAAAEMRQRIAAALQNRLASCPDDAHLKRQLALLNAASITTIDSFCQSVVKQNFHVLGIDPKFRIAADAELTMMRYETIEMLFELKYQNDDAAFLHFIRHYGKQHSDDALYEMLLDLYDYSRSHPNPDIWLDSLLQPFETALVESLKTASWGVFLHGKIQRELSRARRLVKQAREAAAQAQFPHYDKTFMQDDGLIASLQEAFADSWDTAERTFSGCVFARLANAPKDADPEVKEELKSIREIYKELIAKLKERFFYADTAALQADLEQIRPVIAEIIALVKEFASRFAAVKSERGIVDFFDLEHFCLRVLREQTPDGYKPSAVARTLQEKYLEVMCDEFQDTNGLQETILSLVRRDVPNSFFVGDVKQSIYRFRLAEPELFNEKFRTYPRRDERCKLIQLSNNYRSRETVIDAVNFLFSQIMSPECAELDYRGAELIAKASFPVGERLLDGPAELCVIDRSGEARGEAAEEADGAEEGGFYLEAEWIACRIETLLEEHHMVFDAGAYRPLELRDIVILLRAVKGKSDVLLETLGAHDIAAYAELSAGYFEALEVRLMLSLLAILDNPRQDIELAAVLHSPMVGIDAAQLAEIRLTDLDGDLWSALGAFAQSAPPELAALREKACGFLNRFSVWRETSLQRSVPELIWYLFDETGYYDYVGAMEGGALRQANLRMLYDRAREYEATSYRGLFRFLRFIEKMRAKETDLSVARTLSESENVVRIMSIHKSKGLEFPVVFVADIGKGFNMQDQNKLLLLHKKFGLGAFVTSDAEDITAQLRYPSLIRSAIAAKTELELKAEEMRILYVAMTRAKERLILVGSVRNFARRFPRWNSTEPVPRRILPQETIEQAKSYLDWIVPSVLRHHTGARLWEYVGANARQAGPLWDDPVRWQVTVAAASAVRVKTGKTEPEIAVLLENVRQLLPVAPTVDKERVEAALTWRYPYLAAVDKPAKLSVTEMKRRFDAQAEEGIAAVLPVENAAEKPFLRPRFEQEQRGMTAAEYGTVMHSVMQHLPLALLATPEDVDLYIAGFIEREILTPAQAGEVNVPSVVKFLGSPVAERMRQSALVRRELPFSATLPAEKFYPDLAGSGEMIFIQGIIDALFDETDGMVLLDYKTDRLRDDDKIARRHGYQLNLYADAVERILHKRVKEQYLYMLATGAWIRVERN